jgi:xanthine dehydrogenase YagR molybdenum-binding subunit
VAAMTKHNDCPELFTFPARHLYAASSFSIGQKVAEMDMLVNTFMRAPGESSGPSRSRAPSMSLPRR